MNLFCSIIDVVFGGGEENFLEISCKIFCLRKRVALRSSLLTPFKCLLCIQHRFLQFRLWQTCASLGFTPEQTVGVCP